MLAIETSGDPTGSSGTFRNVLYWGKGAGPWYPQFDQSLNANDLWKGCMPCARHLPLLYSTSWKPTFQLWATSWQCRAAHYSIHNTNGMLYCTYLKFKLFIHCVTVHMLNCLLPQLPHLKMKIITVLTSQCYFKNKIQIRQLEQWLTYSKQLINISHNWFV